MPDPTVYDGVVLKTWFNKELVSFDNASENPLTPELPEEPDEESPVAGVGRSTR